MPTSKLNNAINSLDRFKSRTKLSVSNSSISKSVGSKSRVSDSAISNSAISDFMISDATISDAVISGLPTSAQDFLKGMIEELIDGILILTDQRELVYVNNSANRLLKLLSPNQLEQNQFTLNQLDSTLDSTQLNQNQLNSHQINSCQASSSSIPKEIWHVCQSLIQSRNLFPNQHWLMESDIFTDDAIALHIRARWLKLETIEHPCLLLTVEDRHQALKNIAVEEAEKYGLTPREKEVWLLHRANYSYKQIATDLCITPNTVKKHMKHIHAKQKERE